MNKLFLFVLIVSVLISCSKYKDSYNYSKLKKVESLKELFVLNTAITAEVGMIKNKIIINKIYVNKKFMAICDKNLVVYVFSTSGKYIGSLDKKGKGPGEYEYIQQILLIDNNLFINDGSRGILNHYKISDGVLYVDDIDIAKYKIYSPYFAFENDTIVAVAQSTSENISRVHIFDNNFVRKKEFSRGWGKSGASSEQLHCIGEKNIFLLDGIDFKNGKMQLISDKLKIYNYDGKLKKLISFNDKEVYSIHTDIDEKIAILVNLSGKVYLYSLITGKKISTLPLDFPDYKEKRLLQYFFQGKKLIVHYFTDDSLHVDFYDLKLP